MAAWTIGFLILALLFLGALIPRSPEQTLYSVFTRIGRDR